MTDALVVLFGESTAGTISRSPRGELRFEYADSYRRRPDATPLSVTMPTEIATHPDRVVTPWLWGLLPDNNAVLARWARHFHVSASSPFSLLATQIGEDCAGAVRFVPPGNEVRVPPVSGDVTWLTEDDVACRLRDLKEDATAWLGRSFTGQFSLAGAQAKTALLFREGRWGVPSGATPTTHILKPGVGGFDDHDLNEHLCLDAARRAGLLASRTRIGQFGNETAIVVDRYDRVERGGEIIRVHQEDMCQALGILPSRKYENEGGPRPADIAAHLRRVMAPRDADVAVAGFADALAWNWLIGGTDGHAKNYSLLLADKHVRLAPMYDVASALPYGTHERRLRLAMKIGGDYRVFPQHNAWPAAARELGLMADTLTERVRELATVVPHAFADAAGDADVKALDRPLPGKLVDLIADRADRCIRALDTAKPG